jgi:hypothetical protein
MGKFEKGKAGRNAYQVSKVWKLGFHAFICGEDLVFRICYLRNKSGTHYVQLSIKIRECLDCGC